MKHWLHLILCACGAAACSGVASHSLPTPTPTSPNAELFVTLTPIAEPPLIPPSPEGHPTALPPGPAEMATSQPSNARIIIRVAPQSIEVGQTVAITGVPVDLGLPYYTLYLNDEPTIIITYDNELRFQGFTGAVVEFVSASASNTQVEFVLQAAQPGTVEAAINATGEVRLDDGQGNISWRWGGASSEKITLTVTAN